MCEALTRRGFDYILRFRENLKVQEGDGPGLAASAYVPATGRVRMLIGPKLTGKRCEVPAAVFVKRKGMKEAWCLVTSLKDAPSSDIVAAYGRRFTIEAAQTQPTKIQFASRYTGVFSNSCVGWAPAA
jgi:hypothetical protein